MKRAVIKLNEGFSGEGNAIFDYNFDQNNSSERHLVQAINSELPHRIRFEAAGETWEPYLQKFTEMQGIVECWIEGEEKRSPSVQCRIDRHHGV